MNIPSNWESFLPKSILCLRDYTLRKFSADLIADVTVGLVALPLAMAFAISFGLKPQSGIYCAVVAGFLISALGGSSTQIGGPSGAFVVVVAGIVAKHGVDGLFLCTIMAGVFLVLLGVTGLGTAVKYIPRPVVIGFTNGIAVLIARTQLKDFFGLSIEKVPGEFLARMETLAQHRSVSWTASDEKMFIPSLMQRLLAPETDPLHQERQKLETVRRDLASTLERANEFMQLTVGGNRALSPSLQSLRSITEMENRTTAMESPTNKMHFLNVGKNHIQIKAASAPR